MAANIGIRTSVQGTSNSELHFHVDCKSMFDRGRFERDINATIQEIKSIAGCNITPQTKLQIRQFSQQVIISTIPFEIEKNQSYQHLLRAIPRGDGITLQQIERAFTSMPK